MAKYPGRQLTISIGASSPETIGQVTNLGMAGSSRDLIDASAYGDDWKDYVVGQQDGNELDIEIAYDPTDAGAGDILATYDAGTSETFFMQHAESGFHVTFPAMVTKCERGGDLGGLLKMQATLKILNPGVEDVSS